ncbi:MAG: CarD family transcriptional regulator [Oscillospiraceae bacterium]|nr:CarD family transcriptional regulator [Oscillospiraceae bacterium]
MYEAGELVVYSNSGVCKIEEITHQKVPGTGEKKAYYKISPLYSTETIFTPVDSGVFMRPVISKQEATRLIAQMPAIQENACEERNNNLLSEQYQSLIKSHSCTDLVHLIKSIYSKSQLVLKQGKKMGQIDQRFMKRAEELLYGELAVALEIPRQDVLQYINDSLSV